MFVAVTIVEAFPGTAKRWGLSGQLFSGTTYSAYANTAPLFSDSLEVKGESVTAPEFAAGAWINSEPLTLKGLRGRVIVVEFWTFGCYNCQHTAGSKEVGRAISRAGPDYYRGALTRV